ncbi:hypothetical protein J437_LFUL004778 [Ladona fulva]|uniref:inorganic diphosphatase n=1 Tax=Ladona fulva TaxID=123851 RepID=A0A8K0K097_LADFU|nr:hypothetical protein J437_LFUL004778 [Ladona fulva]
MYSVKERGTPNASDYRIYICNESGPISPFHDIPIWADVKEKTVNMIVEMPRWTNAKMEVCISETLNPMKQDDSGGKLRYVKNCFPYHGIMWNYGSIPQTWEDTNAIDEVTKCKGDGEPLDIIDIGNRVPKRGEVIEVKVLGILAVIDRNKTDWKVIGINVDDEMCHRLNDVEDIFKEFPDILTSTKEWLRRYRRVDGKPENEFAFNGEAKGRDLALHVIDIAHNHWLGLIKDGEEQEEISCANVTIYESPFNITVEDALQTLEASPSLQKPVSLDPSIDKWYFFW